MARILIADDDAELAGALVERLSLEGHEARVAPGVARALALARRWHPELAVVGRILADRPGRELLLELRRSGFRGPVLVLSDPGDDGIGVRETADEHVVRSAPSRELVARVETLLRRGPAARLPEVVSLDGRVEIHPRARRLLVDDAEVELRPMEMDLLLALLARRNQAVSRHTLLAEVWGYGPRAETRTVDWHVATLRSKLGESAQRPRYLRTVRGVGYRLDVGEGGGAA